ncbi:MAG: glycosyltransferase [Halofilum sp. (in: g-proteobacteria)]
MGRFESSLFVAQWRLHDRLKYRNRWLSGLLIGAWATLPFSRDKRWHYLLAAHRFSYGAFGSSFGAFAERRIRSNLEKVVDYSSRVLASRSGVDGSTDYAFYQRVIVLKEPVFEGEQLTEKGVLLIKFTDSFVYLYRNFDVNALMEQFYLVLEPSWSGYAQPSILTWLQYPQPILVQASEVRDRRLLEQIGGNLKPLPIGASDWVDHRVFHPLSGYTKDFDAVLIGNAGLAKRIHVYLRAVSRISDPDYHCALVVSRYGQYREKILNLIDYYGLSERVTVFKRMSQQELNVLLNRSKVNLLLSLKEGSNRALFEGFFAGTPALLLRENVGVNKDYVNEYTGRLVDEQSLPDELVYMKQNWDWFQPRQWAMDNISFSRSTERIAEHLREIAQAEGLGFTGTLYEKINVPEIFYPNDPDGSARRRLVEEHVVPLALNQPSAAAADDDPQWKQDRPVRGRARPFAALRRTKRSPRREL